MNNRENRKAKVDRRDLLKRVVSLLLVILMVSGVLLGALSTVAWADSNDEDEEETVKKTITATAAQPQITFYDIENNLIGTFTHASNSNLVGFNSSQVVYQDENGEMVQKTYGRTDVKLFLLDKSMKYKNLTQSRMNSYYLKYELGSYHGGVFANKMKASEGKNGYVQLEIDLSNVAFRDSNEMRWTLSYQKAIKGSNNTSVLRTYSYRGVQTFGKAKLDAELEIQRPDNEHSGGQSFQVDSSGGIIYGEKGDDTIIGDSNGESGGGTGDGGGDTGSGSKVEGETPYLILEGYTTAQPTAVAGSSLPISFRCRNTSTQVDLENIIVKVSASEGLQVTDTTNTFYVRVLGKGDSFDKDVTISALPNAEAKSYAVDVAFSYEYLTDSGRQKGEMTQQISIPVVQQDRFSTDAITGLMESAVGEEFYVTSKYVNKGRGEVYNLSASLQGEFAGSGQTEHIGNIAAGVSGDVEFAITPDAAGPLAGAVVYTYEDAVGTVKTVEVPFSTTILEPPSYEMEDPMAGMGEMMFDENGNPIDPNAQPVNGSFLEQLKNPGSWQLWVTLGGIVLVFVLAAAVVIHKKKKTAAEFEDDDEII